MTQAQLPEMVLVRLYLQEPDARVELDLDVVILVIRWHDADKGGAVCTDLGVFAVAARAQGGMPVAAILSLGSGAVEGLVDLGGVADNCVR